MSAFAVVSVINFCLSWRHWLALNDTTQDEFNSLTLHVRLQESIQRVDSFATGHERKCLKSEYDSVCVCWSGRSVISKLQRVLQDAFANRATSRRTEKNQVTCGEVECVQWLALIVGCDRNCYKWGPVSVPQSTGWEFGIPRKDESLGLRREVQSSSNCFSSLVLSLNAFPSVWKAPPSPSCLPFL